MDGWWGRSGRSDDENGGIYLHVLHMQDALIAAPVGLSRLFSLPTGSCFSPPPDGCRVFAGEDHCSRVARSAIAARAATALLLQVRDRKYGGGPPAAGAGGSGARQSPRPQGSRPRARQRCRPAAMRPWRPQPPMAGHPWPFFSSPSADRFCPNLEPRPGRQAWRAGGGVALEAVEKMVATPGKGPGADLTASPLSVFAPNGLPKSDTGSA
jgi:hypothetical protein